MVYKLFDSNSIENEKFALSECTSYLVLFHYVKIVKFSIFFCNFCVHFWLNRKCEWTYYNDCATVSWPRTFLFYFQSKFSTPNEWNQPTDCICVSPSIYILFSFFFRISCVPLCILCLMYGWASHFHCWVQLHMIFFLFRLYFIHFDGSFSLASHFNTLYISKC